MHHTCPGFDLPSQEGNSQETTRACCPALLLVILSHWYQSHFFTFSDQSCIKLPPMRTLQLLHIKSKKKKKKEVGWLLLWSNHKKLLRSTDSDHSSRKRSKEKLNLRHLSSVLNVAASNGTRQSGSGDERRLFGCVVNRHTSCFSDTVLKKKILKCSKCVYYYIKPHSLLPR